MTGSDSQLPPVSSTTAGLIPGSTEPHYVAIAQQDPTEAAPNAVPAGAVAMPTVSPASGANAASDGHDNPLTKVSGNDASDPSSTTAATGSDSVSTPDASAAASHILSIRQMFRFADATDKLLMFIGLLGAIGYGITQPLMSIVLGDIVQYFVEFEIARNISVASNSAIPLDPSITRLRDAVVKQVLLFFGIGCATMVGAYLMQAMWSWAGERQARRVRARFISAVMQQDLAWFDKNRAGDLTTQLTSDTILFQDGISERFVQGLAYATQFISGFAIAFTVNAELTGILVATFPLFGISGVIVGKAFSEGSAKSQAVYAKAGAVAQEVLSNIRTVSAFGGQQRAANKFSKLLESVVKANERKSWIVGLGFGTFFGLLWGLCGLGFFVGSLIVLRGSMLGGDVVKVIFAVVVGAFAIINIQPFIQALSKGRGAGYRLFQVIDSKPTICDGTKTITNLQGHIRFDNVRFAYPSRPDVITLDGFSMQVEAGQTVALVGLSGSGKSTTVQLLERYYDLLGGCIYIDDIPLHDLSLKWWRSSVGLVSQEPILFDATIAENIAYGASADVVVTRELLEAVCRDANAHEFIQQLPDGYQSMVGERGSLLSGGQACVLKLSYPFLSPQLLTRRVARGFPQKQRIALARALIKNPRILLLDEATSALDTESEAIVQTALDKASEGRTTIVIAHRLSTIRHADKIIVLDKGAKIVEQGSHETLIAAGKLYATLVKAQELKTLRKSQLNIHAPDTLAAGTAADVSTDDEDASDVDDDGHGTAAKPLVAPVKSHKQAVTPLSGVHGMLAEMEREELEKAKLAALLKEKEVPLWRLFKMQWDEWHVLLFGIVMGTAGGVIWPFFGILLAESMSIFQLQGEELRAKALHWFFLFIALMVANLVVFFFQFGCFGVAGERLTKRIRETAFAAMLRQELGWFDNEDNSTGALTTRLSEQADYIQQLTGPNLANLFQLVVSIGTGIGIALYYSWRQTLIVLACVPMIVLGNALESQVISGAINESRKSYAVAGQRACDAITAIATVKALAREQDFIDSYLESVKYPYRAGMRKALVGSIGFGFSQAAQFFLYAVTYYAGFTFIRDGYMSTRELFNCLYVVLFATIAFGQAATFAPNIAKAKAAAIQYFELIDRVPPIDIQRTDGLTPVDVAGHVAVDSVCFTYPSRPATQILRNLSMQALEGKNVALVGPSGCGKSSVLALILRNYDVASGAAKVEGFNVKEWNLQYLRKHMSVVSQEPALFVGTIRENILYGVPDCESATEEQVHAAAKAANLHDFIMGLPEQYETPITHSQLSGGERQRLACARGLIRNPKILLLDEATSALDSSAEKAVQAALDQAANGRTTISIAHRLSTVQGCDTIFVIKKGRVVEQGTHKELLERNGLYAKLVQKQQLGTK